MQRRLRVSNSWLDNTVQGGPRRGRRIPGLLAWNLGWDFQTGQKTWATRGVRRAMQRGPGGLERGGGGVGRQVPGSPDRVPLLF